MQGNKSIHKQIAYVSLTILSLFLSLLMQMDAQGLITQNVQVFVHAGNSSIMDVTFEHKMPNKIPPKNDSFIKTFSCILS